MSVEDVEYEIDKEGSVCLTQLTEVICIPSVIAVMIAKEILYKRKKWVEDNASD